MNTYNNWLLIKALNKHEDLAIKYDKIQRKVNITRVWYDKKINFTDREVVLDIEDIDMLLDNITKVMNKQCNKVYVYNQMKRQDIYLNLIAYNSAFKLKDTLKIELYNYIGVNESSYSSITLSKESARNLYKVLIVIKNIK